MDLRGTACSSDQLVVILCPWLLSTHRLCDTAQCRPHRHPGRERRPARYRRISRYFYNLLHKPLKNIRPPSTLTVGDGQQLFDVARCELARSRTHALTRLSVSWTPLHACCLILDIEIVSRGRKGKRVLGNRSRAAATAISVRDVTIRQAIWASIRGFPPATARAASLSLQQPRRRTDKVTYNLLSQNETGQSKMLNQCHK